MGRLNRQSPNDPMMRAGSPGGTGLQPVARPSPVAQLSFANLREQGRPPSVPTAKHRAHEHARAIDRGAALGAPRRRSDAECEQELATLRRLEALHGEFLAGLGAGATCFAQDFTEWLRRRGDLPDERPGGFDMRRTAAFWIKARARGLVGFDGYAPNGGGARASSTVRTRYRVLHRGGAESAEETGKERAA